MASLEKEITVLIADDDKNIRISLNDILLKNGYKIICEATNGAEALSQCRKLKPDIAVLDIKMPIMSGIEAAKNIISENLCPCVVILTAFNDIESITKASEAGVTGYITKPIEKEHILPNLEIYLKKSAESASIVEDITELRKRSRSHEAVSKAKLLIMENKKCSEQEAFGFIRELSRRKNASMESIALGIIEKFDK